MGMVSTIVINNDLLNEIADDPKFGEKLRRAVNSVSSSRGPELIDHYAYVIETHHRNDTTLVKTGKTSAGEVVREILPWEMQSKKITKKKALELLEVLSTQCDELFSGYSAKFLRQVRDMLKKSTLKKKEGKKSSDSEVPILEEGNAKGYVVVVNNHIAGWLNILRSAKKDAKKKKGTVAMLPEEGTYRIGDQVQVTPEGYVERI